ncbi:MAG: tail fiber domain-containing protein [Thermofilum sp.]|jgi:hypothetical protein|uniref:tail fiber domain-containing protein n=1 Tax=Thermofilum sp. TaxID=1961369 RepID=UPI00258FF638|nr:tail fiber domain-containing protein [Thermofilum sp.]MCI4408208.1 tail fiber domain-containing protein [Thermofilum sp.]
MGWYSTPFNYDGTSPTQVRDDLQKANENFQALSDVFENGTPLSGRIKSSYIPGGGGGSVSGDITVNSVTISNPNKVNFGIDLSSNPSGFYQAAIKMPVGVMGSAIQWQPTSGGWGVGESKLGVDSAGNFRIIGRYDSSGRRVINLHDDVNVVGQLIPISIRLAPQSNQNSLIDLRSGAVDCSGAYILMPTGGVKGNFISWGDPPYDNTLIGVALSQGNTLVISGKPDPAKGNRRQIGMWDDVTIYGNLSVIGTITGNVVYQVPSTIGVKKVDINADANQDYGINFRNSNGFTQSAILMPTGGNGSFINWGNTNPYDCLIGISSSLGQFIIAGKSNGVSRDTHVYENLIVHGYTTSVGFALNTSVAQDYGLNLRGSSGFNQAAILMPMSGKGTFISWGDPAYDNSLIGIQNSTGHFVISGRADAAYGGRRTIYMYDDTIMTGNAYVSGNLTVSGTISGNISLPSAPTFQHVDIKTTSSDTYGLNFRNGVNNFTGSACIIMPSPGTAGNQILWGSDPSGDSRIGLSTNGTFFVIGSGTAPNRVVTISDHLTVTGNLTVNGTISGNISLPSTPTFRHIDIQTTSSDTYGLNFRNGYNNFTSSACILMPTSGNGNKISWGNPDYDSTIGLSSSGQFFIFGSGASPNRTVYIYDVIHVAQNAIIDTYLTVASDTTIGGNLAVRGTITQGSDLSMKENIELFSDSALNLLKSIDVYKYLFKATQEEHVGFVANYVKDVFPNGVTVNEQDGTCSINILDMLALLFKAVKELAEHVANN